jgi:hypothetical protein
MLFQLRALFIFSEESPHDKVIMCIKNNFEIFTDDMSDFT